MNRDEVKIDTLDLHALQELTAEMKCCRRSHHATLIASEYCLIALTVGKRMVIIDRLIYHITTILDHWRNRGLAIAKEHPDELLMSSIKQESQSTSSRCGIVNHLGYKTVVLTEIEFVANSDLASRIDQHIPETCFSIQFSQQENLDARPCLLLVAVETSWKDLGIVEEHKVFLVKIVDELLEYLVLNLFAFLVEHHKTGFITMFCWQKRNMVFWEFEFEL